MPSVTPNRSNSSQNTAAPFSRDPTGAERQHWELNSLEDNSLFVLQISIISDYRPPKHAAIDGIICGFALEPPLFFRNRLRANGRAGVHEAPARPHGFRPR